MDLSTLVNLAFFLVSVTVLIIGADKFVGGTEELGLVLGVPQFVLGITVLAVGTSFPELITAVYAVIDGNSEIVIGTVIGSNVANILLILGLTAMFAKSFHIKWDLLHGDLPMLFGSLLMLAFVVYPLSAGDLAQYQRVAAEVAAGGRQTGSDPSAGITWLESLLLLTGYGLYLHYYVMRQTGDQATPPGEPAQERPPFRGMTVFWVLAGLAGVLVGAKFTVDYAVLLAETMGIGNEVVAASLIALGTSTPELVVSISAARRNNFEMVLGNVTGSNIFNTFVVLGLPGLLAPFLGDGKPLRVGEASVMYLQMPYYGATLLLFLVVVLDKNLTRTEGSVIFLAYVLFMLKLFSLL